MSGNIKEFIKELCYRSGIYFIMQLSKMAINKEDGWIRSIKNRSAVNKDGDPIPWFTYSAYKFLDKRIKKDFIILEYGSGNSTLWWAKKVKYVVSYEHDKNWYEKLKRIIPHNVMLKYIEIDEQYINEILNENNKFDIIVIDGRHRVECVKKCLSDLKQDGIIVWDDTFRIEYKEEIEFLYRNGFKRIEFIGMSPAVHYNSETSIFYRKNNNLDI